MLDYLRRDRWSPYIVGALLALLSTASFAFTGKMLGSSTTFVRLSAALTSFFAPGYVADNTYYASILEGNAWIDWQVMLLIGVVVGSYLAGDFIAKSPVIHVPALWERRFGPSRGKRYLGAFIGGVIILFGARLAGGCTSGHGISGGMQLSVAGWLFMVGLFGIGVPTAFLLYGVPQGER